MKGIEGHPRIRPPGYDDVQAESAVSGIKEEAALEKLMRMRAASIAAEEADPLRRGWEPPIWHVCDALLGFEWCYDGAFLRELERRLGLGWSEFCGRMRERLGYKEPVKMLLVMGGNRAGKSEYAAKRGMQTMVEKAGARVYAFHMSEPRSKRDQQPLFWNYMPYEWKTQTAEVTTYIKYKKKTGFADNSFILPNGSEGVFLNYMQDKDTALQGLEGDLALADELIPADWVEDLLLRLATRAGKGVLTFTPVNGYTPTVKLFCDGAQAVRRVSARLCPLDGGDADEAGALGLADGEYRELWAAVEKKRVPLVPQSVPEDVIGWLEKEGRGDRGEEKGGRVFEETPRVLKCVDPRKAVVYFNPSDNPYGNPKEVAATLRGKPRWYVRERFYGVAEKTISVMIPKFSRVVHVVRAAGIPAGGTNYMFYDPASERNSFMLWMRRCGKDAYLYREWPGKYAIPGVGVPGPWAIPSGRKDGRNDGAPGEGQRPAFGFGNARYKFEMARLEGWEDWKRWRGDRNAGVTPAVPGGAGRGATREEYPAEEELAAWDERNGADEVITSRFIDSRAASAPRIEKDRPVTLQTLFDELHVFFFLTPGADICDGVAKINSALDWQEGVNPPHFFVSEECENSIYALENWMNADGQNGACKDPIDLMRYFFMAECEDVGPNDYAGRGGVAYGVRRAGGRIMRGARHLPRGGE